MIKKNNFVIISKFIIFLLGICFLLMHVKFNFIIISYEISTIIVFFFIVFLLFQLKLIKLFHKLFLKTIFLLIFATFFIVSIKIFNMNFIFLLASKPRLVIEQYQINKKEYIKTISWNLDETMISNPIEIIYERDFGLGTYCYSVIEKVEVKPDSFFLAMDEVKKKINLKQKYDKLKDKKISFCGRNLSSQWR